MVIVDLLSVLSMFFAGVVAGGWANDVYETTLGRLILGAVIVCALVIPPISSRELLKVVVFAGGFGMALWYGFTLEFREYWQRRRKQRIE